MIVENYQFIVVLILTSLVQVECLTWTACGKTEDCHDVTRVCRTGVCICMSGYVEWKWECHPAVGLGESCITSVQCKSQEVGPSHVCNPITHKCSCERGFTPVFTDGHNGLVCRPLGTPQPEHGYIEHILGLNNVWTAAAAQSGNISTVSKSHLHTSSVNGAQPNNVSRPSTGRSSWMLITVLLLASGGALLLTGLYIKTLQEKRASQARVKSLLRVVAEQSEIRPSLTSLTSFTSNIDLEDVYCSNYSISGATNIHCNTVKTPGDPEKRRELETKFQEMQLPPSYEDLLK